MGSTSSGGWEGRGIDAYIQTLSQRGTNDRLLISEGVMATGDLKISRKGKELSFISPFSIAHDSLHDILIPKKKP